MEQQLLDQIVAFRRDIHQHPEITFQEFQTHQRIKTLLLSFGVQPQSIREVAKEHQPPTGLIVDLSGKAQPKGKDFCVAFRADMDALPMTELNQDLPYISKNKGSAHMCGHDGHVACLAGFVPLFLREINNIPSNKKVRLIFQPAEETVNGAVFMVEKGCLEGVDEVYGFHNWPVGKFGDIWCKEGPVMSQASVIKIKIVGDGGHGSAPQGLKVAIWKAVWFHTEMKYFVDKLQSQGRQFACTFPVLQSGERFNVIGESAAIQGTLRVFEDETQDLVFNKIKELLGSIEKQGFKVELNTQSFSITSNTKKEADNVIRVAKEFLGQDKVGSGTLPFRASQDFGIYTQHRPGAFFFFCTKKKEDEVFLHNPRFNFKDELIEKASTFWLKLAQDRLSSI